MGEYTYSLAPSHCSELMIFMDDQRKNKDENLCDVRFTVDNDCIYGHRSVLAVFSAYFQGLLSGAFSESQGEDGTKSRMMEVDFTGSVSNIAHLDTLLSAAYTGILKLSPDNITGVTELACFLLVERVKVLCEAFMVETLTLTTCLPYLHLGYHYDLRLVFTACRQMLQSRFHDHFIHQRGMLGLAAPCLHLLPKIYTNVHLQDLFQFFVSWVEAASSGGGLQGGGGGDSDVREERVQTACHVFTSDCTFLMSDTVEFSDSPLSTRRSPSPPSSSEMLPMDPECQATNSRRDPSGIASAGCQLFDSLNRARISRSALVGSESVITELLDRCSRGAKQVDAEGSDGPCGEGEGSCGLQVQHACDASKCDSATGLCHASGGKEENAVRPGSKDMAVESDNPTSHNPTSDNPTSNNPTSANPTSANPTSDNHPSTNRASDNPTSNNTISANPGSDTSRYNNHGNKKNNLKRDVNDGAHASCVIPKRKRDVEYEGSRIGSSSPTQDSGIASDPAEHDERGSILSNPTKDTDRSDKTSDSKKGDECDSVVPNPTIEPANSSSSSIPSEPSLGECKPKTTCDVLVACVPSSKVVNYFTATDVEKNRPRSCSVDFEVCLYHIQRQRWLWVGRVTFPEKFEDKDSWKMTCVNRKAYFVSLHRRLLHVLDLETLAWSQLDCRPLLEEMSTNSKIRSLTPISAGGSLYVLASDRQWNEEKKSHVCKQRYFRLGAGGRWEWVVEVEHCHAFMPLTVLTVSERKVFVVKATVAVNLEKSMLILQEGHVFDSATGEVSRFNGSTYAGSPIRPLIRDGNIHIVDGDNNHRKLLPQDQCWESLDSVNLSDIKITRAASGESFLPCMTHCSCAMGASVWEMCAFLTHRSTLTELHLDRHQRAFTVRHPPPPFRYVAAMSACGLNTEFVSSLRTCRYMHADVNSEAVS